MLRFLMHAGLHFYRVWKLICSPTVPNLSVSRVSQTCPLSVPQLVRIYFISLWTGPKAFRGDVAFISSACGRARRPSAEMSHLFHQPVDGPEGLPRRFSINFISVKNPKYQF